MSAPRLKADLLPTSSAPSPPSAPARPSSNPVQPRRREVQSHAGHGLRRRSSPADQAVVPADVERTAVGPPRLGDRGPSVASPGPRREGGRTTLVTASSACRQPRHKALAADRGQRSLSMAGSATDRIHHHQPPREAPEHAGRPRPLRCAVQTRSRPLTARRAAFRCRWPETSTAESIHHQRPPRRRGVLISASSDATTPSKSLTSDIERTFDGGSAPENHRGVPS